MFTIGFDITVTRNQYPITRPSEPSAAQHNHTRGLHNSDERDKQMDESNNEV